MWCDLRKPVTWFKIGILSFWYHVKVWIILFPERFYLDLLRYWYQKLLMIKGYKNKEKHQNCDVNFLYFTVFPFVTCDRFYQITSHVALSNLHHDHVHLLCRRSKFAIVLIENCINRYFCTLNFNWSFWFKAIRSNSPSHDLQSLRCRQFEGMKRYDSALLSSGLTENFSWLWLLFGEYCSLFHLFWIRSVASIAISVGTFDVDIWCWNFNNEKASKLAKKNVDVETTLIFQCCTCIIEKGYKKCWKIKVEKLTVPTWMWRLN